jgi:hypothetical protein
MITSGVTRTPGALVLILGPTDSYGSVVAGLRFGLPFSSGRMRDDAILIQEVGRS